MSAFDAAHPVWVVVGWVPFVFAAELGDDWFKAEFFIRTLEGMGCDCQDYATPQQREFILDFCQTMIDALDVQT